MNPVLQTVGNDVFVLEVGMDFYLVYNREDCCEREKAAEAGSGEVGYAFGGQMQISWGNEISHL